jgi:long-subunit acyl-CoA synthetase (AMP-forming)
LILKKIKIELGLDRVEQAYFGAAPMSREVKKFFMSLGMPLINMYGLSETSGAATYMDNLMSFDKAGKALPGTQIKIFNPDESGIGEICIRGRNVFMGYLNNEAATFEVMDSEGFFHTGDIGVIDPNTGFLEITDR